MPPNRAPRRQDSQSTNICQTNALRRGGWEIRGARGHRSGRSSWGSAADVFGPQDRPFIGDSSPSGMLRYLAGEGDGDEGLRGPEQDFRHRMGNGLRIFAYGLSRRSGDMDTAAGSQGTRKGHKTYQRIIMHIRGAISSGELRPGDRLPPETELARSLGVSRPTVR